MRTPSLITAIIGLALLASAPSLKAAELKVLAGSSTTDSMGELGPMFERLTGHKLTFQFGGTPDLIKQATSGALFDLAVVPVDVMKDAGARATFAAGPTIDVARVGYGVAYRTGAPKPDVSTPDAMKQSLFKAQSVSLYPESAAGAYVLKTFERLGIAEAMKASQAAAAGSDRRGRRQGRCRPRGVSYEPADCAGRRTRWPLPSRIAAGPGDHRRDRRQR
jgi:molybdate transport system substrate-binding protein